MPTHDDPYIWIVCNPASMELPDDSPCTLTITACCDHEVRVAPSSMLTAQREENDGKIVLFVCGPCFLASGLLQTSQAIMIAPEQRKEIRDILLGKPEEMN
jgi:hypothetical protein